MAKSVSSETNGKSKAKTKTLAYDVSEQLRTPQEMAAYLDAWLVDAPDDAAGIARALGDIARAKACRKSLATQVSAANTNGVTNTNTNGVRL